MLAFFCVQQKPVAVTGSLGQFSQPICAREDVSRFCFGRMAKPPVVNLALQDYANNPLTQFTQSDDCSSLSIIER